MTWRSKTVRFDVEWLIGLQNGTDLNILVHKVVWLFYIMGGSPGELSEALLILQTFRQFTYVTTHSQTLPSLYLVTVHSSTLPLLHLCYSSFSNPSFASPTSQALNLRHLAGRPCLRSKLCVYFKSWIVVLQYRSIQHYHFH